MNTIINGSFEKLVYYVDNLKKNTDTMLFDGFYIYIEWKFYDKYKNIEDDNFYRLLEKIDELMKIQKGKKKLNLYDFIT